MLIVISGAIAVNVQDRASENWRFNANYSEYDDDFCRHKDLAYAANVQ